jgi:hypothetical protein
MEATVGVATSLLSLGCVLLVCHTEGLLRDWATGRHRWTLPPLILLAVAVLTTYSLELTEYLRRAALQLLVGS